VMALTRAGAITFASFDSDYAHSNVAAEHHDT
jgi:hypothetical protein